MCSHTGPLRVHLGWDSLSFRDRSVFFLCQVREVFIGSSHRFSVPRCPLWPPHAVNVGRLEVVPEDWGTLSPQPCNKYPHGFGFFVPFAVLIGCIFYFLIFRIAELALCLTRSTVGASGAGFICQCASHLRGVFMSPFCLLCSRSQLSLPALPGSLLIESV